MVAAYGVFLALIVIERLVELIVSRRNQAWAMERGGVEYGREHFPLMSLIHIAFLTSCVLEAWFLERPFIPWLAAGMLALAVAAQLLRYWAIATLGRLWNVRVIVVPGVVAVTGGPYRYLRHPNYLAVIVEMVAIPMIHTGFVTAIVFSLLNVWILTIRIRCEESALEQFEQYQARLGSRPRFVPSAPATTSEDSAVR